MESWLCPDKIVTPPDAMHVIPKNGNAGGLVASKSFQRAELILTELPLAVIQSAENKERVLNQCLAYIIHHVS